MLPISASTSSWEKRIDERAFTMVELVTVMCIMLILATLFISAYSYLRNRAERANCISNLQNLYTAGQAYLVDHDYVWPQIPNVAVNDPSFAQAWVSTLQPYQLGPVNWICPTTQRAYGNPSYTTPQGVRVDYIGTAFPNTKYAAYQWPTHPWFSEYGAGHGDGPLLVFTNGQVLSLNQATQIQSIAPQ